MFKISFLPLIILVLFSAVQDPESELTKFWEEASRAVQDGDFKGYADTFHKDAVLVNGIAGNSYPISNALEGWKKGFEDTKAGKMKASVEFRFSERFYSETTAYETGIFKYSSQNKGEEQSTVYIHFEALLTKASGEWKLLMEHQVSVATEDEWNSIK
ncbi:MAG: nuclear transport factor 2 family protein [Balneola sp.]|nr:nuclear transport factor 2 family protein [Balneola sp.]